MKMVYVVLNLKPNDMRNLILITIAFAGISFSGIAQHRPAPSHKVEVQKKKVRKIKSNRTMCDSKIVHASQSKRRHAHNMDGKGKHKSHVKHLDHPKHS